MKIYVHNISGGEVLITLFINTFLIKLQPRFLDNNTPFKKIEIFE